MNPPWFFEDFFEGQRLPSSEIAVSADELAWFDARFGRLLVAPEGSIAGWHVSALGMRLIYDSFLYKTASLGSPGIETAEWQLPVRVGDRLRLAGEVSTLRVSRSRPDMGLVGFALALENQHGHAVMRQSNVILVRRRGTGGET